MTLTMKPLTAGIALVLIGVLIGLSIGGLTDASGGSADSRKLNQIKAKLGNSEVLPFSTVSKLLDQALFDIENTKKLALIICNNVEASSSLCSGAFNNP